MERLLLVHQGGLTWGGSRGRTLSISLLRVSLLTIGCLLRNGLLIISVGLSSGRNLCSFIPVSGNVVVVGFLLVHQNDTNSMDDSRNAKQEREHQIQPELAGDSKLNCNGDRGEEDCEDNQECVVVVHCQSPWPLVPFYSRISPACMWGHVNTYSHRRDQPR